MEGKMMKRLITIAPALLVVSILCAGPLVDTDTMTSWHRFDIKPKERAMIRSMMNYENKKRAEFGEPLLKTEREYIQLMTTSAFKARWRLHRRKLMRHKTDAELDGLVLPNRVTAEVPLPETITGGNAHTVESASVASAFKAHAGMPAVIHGTDIIWFDTKNDAKASIPELIAKLQAKDREHTKLIEKQDKLYFFLAMVLIGHFFVTAYGLFKLKERLDAITKPKSGGVARTVSKGEF
jgi:hypothetical protein